MQKHKENYLMENHRNNYGLTERDMKTFLQIFKRYPSVKEVKLFGSRAKGNFKPGSDIDLAVMNKEVDENELLHLRSEIDESSLPYRIDLVNYNNLTRTDFIDHINRVGVLFFKSEIHD